MNLENVMVSDIETDGLLDTLTKMHVMSVGWKNKDGKWQIKSSPNKEDVVKVFCNPDNIIVMHNGRRFDKPALERIFNIKVTAIIIDSLAVAWAVEPLRTRKFGLETYGEDFGVPKPKIDDWDNLPYEVYEQRCTSDVKINILLWEQLYEKLKLIYASNPEDMVRLIHLLNWIMDCSYMQELQKIKVDVSKTEETLSYFEGLKEQKIESLKKAMPKVKITSLRSKPKVFYKKDNSLSESGKKWNEMLSACNLPEDYEGQIEVITGYEEPNPNSVTQKKQWLYSLSWKPKTFKHNRNKETNEVKIVEQIMTEDKMLCPSVLELADKEPAIHEFDGLTVLTHRIGILKGFLKDRDENDMIYQGLQQLAITLRWMHSKIVNLPRFTGKGDLRDGKWIRECLIAGEGKKIVQSDLSGIESRTSDHYTFHINRERIEKTKQQFFDPHTEISVASNLMTADEEIWFKYIKEKKDLEEKGEDSAHIVPELFGEPSDEFYKLLELTDREAKDKMNQLKIARSKGKTTNYASLYNVQKKTLARNLEISEKEAQKLIDAYWEVNFAVKEATKSFKTQMVGNEQWIFNPISKFWYILKQEQNKFSVVNQSSAVYCFNIWVWNCTRMGIWPVTQSHDDQLYIVDEAKTTHTQDIINEAMRRTNSQLKLNSVLDCETQIGNSVADTH